MKIHSFDERRDIVIPGDLEETIDYAVAHFIECANAAIRDHGFFAVALSGGSTPKKIFQKLSSPSFKEKVDWSCVKLFWSDERSVAPDNQESNYHMAMVEGGLNTLGIPREHIFRMVAENKSDADALAYEKAIKHALKDRPFDLVMLGLGEDGHTASLFPHTDALKVEKRLVVPNYVSQKETWRMTFTYTLINQSAHICFYALGEGKSKILQQVLASKLQPETFPSQQVGTSSNRALWIIDNAASQDILASLK